MTLAGVDADVLAKCLEERNELVVCELSLSGQDDCVELLKRLQNLRVTPSATLRWEQSNERHTSKEGARTFTGGAPDARAPDHRADDRSSESMGRHGPARFPHPQVPVLARDRRGVRLPFMRRVHSACSSRSLKRQRAKPNDLPAKQDQDTSSDSEHSQYGTDGWNWNADHLQ